MKKIKKYYKKGFSLIELSIVLLIIGIVVAGVTQSSRLIAAFKLSSARSITQSSPVSSIPDLAFWLDTVSQDSFNDYEAENDAFVSVWKDLNPASANKQILTQTSDSRPKYIADCINNLPCLRFDGINDSFSFNGDFLIGTNYTVFIVEQRRSGNSDMNFIGGSGLDLNSNFHMGYVDESTILFGQYLNDYFVSVASYDYNPPLPRIHTYRHSASAGINYFINADFNLYTQSSANSGGVNDHLVSYPDPLIGGNAASSTFYIGDIAEIIMFTRALKESERLEVLQYLTKKWKVITPQEIVVL